MATTPPAGDARHRYPLRSSSRASRGFALPVANSVAKPDPKKKPSSQCENTPTASNATEEVARRHKANKASTQIATTPTSSATSSALRRRGESTDGGVTESENPGINAINGGRELRLRGRDKRATISPRTLSMQCTPEQSVVAAFRRGIELSNSVSPKFGTTGGVFRIHIGREKLAVKEQRVKEPADPADKAIREGTLLQELSKHQREAQIPPVFLDVRRVLRTDCPFVELLETEMDREKERVGLKTSAEVKAYDAHVATETLGGTEILDSNDALDSEATRGRQRVSAGEGVDTQDDQRFMLFMVPWVDYCMEELCWMCMTDMLCVLFQVLFALAFAQEKMEFVHYDLHLGNILLSFAGSRGQDVESDVFSLGNGSSRASWRIPRRIRVYIGDLGLSRGKLASGRIVYNVKVPHTGAFDPGEDVRKLESVIKRISVTSNELIDVDPEAMLYPLGEEEKQKSPTPAELKRLRGLYKLMRKGTRPRVLLEHQLFVPFMCDV